MSDIAKASAGKAEHDIASAAKAEHDIKDLVAAVDTGARSPKGAVGFILAAVAVTWSLFQLYTASNLPFTLTQKLGVNVIFNIDEVRSIHLAFAMFLAFMSYPAFRSSPRDRVPLFDWGLALAAVACCLYLVVFKDQIVRRPGLPTTSDLWIAGTGMVLLLVATYRTLGLPLVIVALVFLGYVFFGNQPWIPDAIQWRGASFGRAMWHFWMQSEGVFGVALGVSASFVFLFVLFGALLDRAGAGNYFIKVSFALLGHLRGGPAKAAVLSSAMTGVISGSSIANVVTTGTFTIPLMKRVGFSAEKAGAVEVGSSVNGQLMPPVMGAAAFLMVEFVGITYLEVIRHAFLPAAISYVALLYIVHLEALKAGMRGLPKPGPQKTLMQALIGALTGFLVMAVLVAVIYYGLGWTKAVFGPNTIYMAALFTTLGYLALLALAARQPDLVIDDPKAPVVELPELGPTVKTGLYFLLPIVVLVWCLVIERLSPGLSAFWASLVMIVILLTQRPLKALFRGGVGLEGSFAQGVRDLIDGLIAGARNMTGIAVATGTAGIVVGTVALTGFHQVIGEFIEFLSGGSLILMLLFVALMSLILGMGLPTTANYIVVSSLMAGVVVELGAQNGLLVPLIAVHLFVFYFGIMADVTPPVGLASFAAAAVSGGNPLKTGVTAFFYSLRTATLPFMFIFNTQLLLIGIDNYWHLGLTIVAAVVAMLVFAAGTMGYFWTRSRLWETLALLLVAFTLLRPGFWMDMIHPEFEPISPLGIVEMADDLEVQNLRVRVQGVTFEGREIDKLLLLPLGRGPDGEARLFDTGVVLVPDGDVMVVDNVRFGSRADRLGLDFDFRIVEVLVVADRPMKEWFYLPAFALTGLVMLAQWRRMRN
ncbi:MAG: TRAP transporter fused permease subunit [Geminicoccaceae bacterium]|nr:MAG: TRAP transporter fused permease subunit [Geminicoccaceae bacterium]